METTLRELFERRGEDISPPPEMPARLRRRVRFYRARYTVGVLALAAAVAFGALTGARELFAIQDRQPADRPAPVPEEETTEVEVAEAYFEARNAYDAAQARELVSEDFTTNEYPDGWRNVENMELAFEVHNAYGFHYSEIECTPEGDTSEGVSVRCAFLWTTELHSVGNHSPTPASTTLVIEEGLITQIMRGSQPFADIWNPWRAFLRAEHPEFLRVEGQVINPLDPDSVRELVEQMPLYLELYQEWLNSEEDGSPSSAED